METEVVEKAGRGDREAFGRIIDEYYKDAYVFSLSLTGNIHDAMDVCQDSFIKAYRNISKLGDAGKLKSWLMKIVANTSRDLLRARRHKEVGADDLYEVFAESSLEGRIDLFSALMKLPPGYRQVLVLRYFNDLKISRIGNILRIPESTVKSRLRYALERMKHMMEVV